MQVCIGIAINLMTICRKLNFRMFEVQKKCLTNVKVLSSYHESAPVLRLGYLHLAGHEVVLFRQDSGCNERGVRGFSGRVVGRRNIVRCRQLFRLVFVNFSESVSFKFCQGTPLYWSEFTCYGTELSFVFIDRVRYTIIFRIRIEN